MAAAGVSRGQKLIGLLKQGWNEIPEVVGSTGLALVGLVMISRSIYKSYQEGEPNRRYKLDYIIMRPDDPRAKFVHKD